MMHFHIQYFISHMSKSLTYSMDLRFSLPHRQKKEALCHTVNLRNRLYVHLNYIATIYGRMHCRRFVLSLLFSLLTTWLSTTTFH